MSIYGKYFVNHYEAKVFAGVLALLNGAFYVGFALLCYRGMKSNQ